MINFNLKKTAIFQAVRHARNPIFKFSNFLKNVFFLLVVLFLIIFLYGFILGGFTDKILLRLVGGAIVFLDFSIIFWLINCFFNSKLKEPSLRVKIEEAIKSPEEYNLAKFLGLETASAVLSAKNNTTRLLYELLSHCSELNFIFYRAMLSPKEIKKILRQYLHYSKKISVGKEMPLEFQSTILDSLKIAQKKGHKRVGIGDMLVALALNDLLFKKILVDSMLKAEDIKNLVNWLESIDARIEKRKKFWEWENLIIFGAIGKDWATGYTPTLDGFSVDITELVKRKSFPETIGHEKEIFQMERILARREINNALIVGEPGSGRKSMIEALATRSAMGKSLPEINYKRVVRLDLTFLLAKTGGPEECESMLDIIFREVISAGNIILVIDDFHDFVGGMARPGAIDISGALMPYLPLPEFQIATITTYGGLHKAIEMNSSLLNFFEKIEVSEVSEREALTILENLTLSFEYKYKKFISYLALKDIVRYCAKYLPSIPFPEKAIKLLDEAVTYLAQKREKVLLPKHIARVFSEKSQIPVGEIETREKEILLKLENLMHRRIVGQEEAVREVSMALRRARAEISARSRPMGSFLFLGPTGVGKCVVPDTLLFTSRGILPIEKFIPKNLEEDKTLALKLKLLGKDGPEFTSQIYNGGIKPTLKIKTAFGYEIEGTLIHPILTVDQNGDVVFKRLQELQKGDYVVIQRNQQYFSKDIKIKFNFEKSPHDRRSRSIKIPKILTKELARLLGYLVGEGYTVSKKTTRFSNIEKSTIEDVRNILKDTFGLKLIHYKTDKPQDFWIHSVRFRQFLEKIGVNYGKSDSKEIPEIILRAPKEFVVEYLRGYFEAEGSPILSDPQRIEVATASKKMAKQLHVLLLNFGIVSNLRETFNKKTKKFYHRIEIFGENIDIFAKEIGFLSKDKITRLNALLNKKRNPNLDTIPFIKEKLLQLKRCYFEEGHNYRGVSHTYCLQNWYPKNISHNTLGLVLEECKIIETTPQFRVLKGVLDRHYLYLPVNDIIPGKSQVYDFVVPESHSFFGNGFINHNTETSKAVAEFYFGSEKRMIRLDMSEFQDVKDIPRLIGSSGEEGLLTTPVRENPFSVVLLDEIEKAYPNILNLFLQVLDEGFLTDGLGRKVFFRETIIIATSNAGYQFILQAIKEKTDWSGVKEKLLDGLFEKGLFRPEFINRFDAVVVFKPLEKNNLMKIAELMLQKIKKGLAEKEIGFSITELLKEKIVELSYDPKFGAREMRRVIQDKVENILASAILSGTIKRGDKIEIDPASFQILKK